MAERLKVFLNPPEEEPVMWYVLLPRGAVKVTVCAVPAVDGQLDRGTSFYQKTFLRADTSGAAARNVI